MELRKYQADCVDSVYKHFETKKTNPCVVIPTGGGKTPIIAKICSDFISWGMRVVILAHNKELLVQSAEKLKHFIGNDYDSKYSFYCAGLNEKIATKPITIASIQSIFRNALDFDPFDLIIVDEAHLIPPNGEGMYQTFINECRIVNPHIKILGLTATPYRLKSGNICGPENILNEICYEISVKQLINDGYLSKIINKISEDSKLDLESIKIKGGEFDQQELSETMENKNLIEITSKELIRRTINRKSVLIFCTSIIHAEATKNKIQELTESTKCEFICGDTPSNERDDILKRFKNEEIKYLTNVNVLTTGFDATCIDCIVLLRPTMSAGLYYQMVGRGFRLHPGKKDCLVLDFSGNIARHGPIDQIDIKSKKDKNKNKNKIDTKLQKKCKTCEAIIGIRETICPICESEQPIEIKNNLEPDEKSDIISDSENNEIEVKNYHVISVSYSIYQKTLPNGDISESMKVTYCIGLYKYFSEWICFNHSGYARKKAETWWINRSNVRPVPDSVRVAVDYALAGAIARTIAITTTRKHGQKYPEITGYQFEENFQLDDTKFTEPEKIENPQKQNDYPKRLTCDEMDIPW